MNARKRQKIEEQLAKFEECLANAQGYISRGVNVEGTSFLHLGDWRGKSGHPSWMENVMIPRTLKHRAHQEKALEKIGKKVKEIRLSQRRRSADQ